MKNKKFSAVVTEGLDKAPNRAMLRAVGFKNPDFDKPMIGVASTWAMVTPCNMHINKLADFAAKGVNTSGGKSVIFNTITVSDGISMGTPGMKYSLISREVIADSIETVTGAEGFDGIVAIGGCDKNMPGCLMAMARLNRPSIFIYGGSIMPGTYNKKPVDIVSVFEAVGEYSNKSISKSELIKIEKCAIPGPGSCGGMYTANTMASAIEALGMSLPGSSTQIAISKNKELDCIESGKALLNLIKKDIKPRDIMTKKAFENAITVTIALGGSTNAVLHLLAMASAAGVNLKIDDFTKIGKKVPVLADLKPSGTYMMAKFCEIGGLPPLLKRLLNAGLIHGECLTVTGKSIKENLSGVKDNLGADVIKKARNKIRTYKDVIQDNPKTPYIVFADDNSQLDELKIAHKEIIYEINQNSVKILKDDILVFSGNTEPSERKIILEQTVGQKTPIFAMYCLDEGIDVPEFNAAILVSSSRSNRQYIQRRGRILRKAKREQIAQLYDIVVFPPKQEQAGKNEIAISVVAKEFERVSELSSDAINKHEALRLFDEKKHRQGFH